MHGFTIYDIPHTMKQYVIDELRLEDYEKLKTFMDENYKSSQLDGIYWIPLEKNLLTDTQSEHRECQPFYFAVDVEETMISCEFLVRTKNRIRCDCIDYATEKQRNWMIHFIDEIFKKNEIIT